MAASLTRPRVVVLFVGTVVVIVLSALAAVGAVRATLNTHAAVAHTQEVRFQIEQVVSLVLEAESNQRSYLLTDHSEYLRSYSLAVESLAPVLERLKALTSDNPPQRRRVDDLGRIANARVASLERGRALYAAGDRAAATTYARADAGRALRAELVTEAASMQSEEQRLLAQRSAAAERAVRYGVVAVLASGALALALLIILQRSNALAAAALWTSEQHLSTTLQSIGDGVIATDAAACVTMMNRAAEMLTGWSTAAARGIPVTTVFNIVDESTRATLESPVARVLASGAVQGTASRSRLLGKDGHEWPIEDNAAPIRDGAGTVTGVVLVFREISVRRALERALIQTNEETRSRADELEFIYATTPIGLGILDRELRYIRVNERLADLHGVPPDEHLGRTVREVVPLSADVLEPLFRQVLATGRPVLNVEVEGETRANPGVRRTWLKHARALQDASGQVIGINIATEEITERKRAEERLAARTAELRLALEAGRAGTFAFDLERDRAAWSPELERLFGLSPGAFANDRNAWVAHVVKEDAERVQQGFLDAWANGVTEHQYEFRAVLPNGMRRWFAGRARIEYAPDGHPRRMTGLNVDVDERRRLEDALLVADQRKDEFLATLAHELRNPLAPIRNAVSVLRGARDDPAVLEQVGDVVERQVALMGRLLDDLLDTSRITRNVLTLRKERVLLSRIVDTALESSRPFIDAQMQQLTVRLPPEPIALDADPDRLAQVLTNLLNNAAKYTEQGGQILLTAECADGRLRLCVRDTGIGIPADKLDRVFDLFAQVAPQSDSARHGLGIGLALSKRLVEMHQGTISVTSAGVGAGSEFVISLPLPAAGVVAIPRTAQMPPRPPAARKILVVDDNVDAAKTLQLVLALDGHAVTIAHDGLEGIEAAEAQRPDVILMDLGMPRLDGCEAARRLRSRAWSNGTVLVALTGWGQESDRARVTAAGFDHHLVKPVDPDALAALLRDVHAGGGVGAPEAAAFDAIRLVEGVSPTGNVGP